MRSPTSALAPAVLGGALVLAPSGGIVGPAACARADQDAADPDTDPVADARRLKDEAREFFNDAGDMDNSHSERRKSRKEAYTRLKEARALLDAWIDDHPGDLESLDSLYVEITSMLYWVRKEAGVDEFGPERKAPSGRQPPPKGDVPVAGQGAEPGAGTEQPTEPQGPTAADVLAEIETYGKRYPGDVPGLHERYVDFVALFPDRATDEYGKALAQIEQLGKRLKDVYRLTRDEDPDALKDVDDAEVLKLVKELTDDLENGSEPVRERAARFLGGLGSGEAADPLIAALEREQSGPVFDAVVESLSKVGGTRVCKRLSRIKPKAALGPTVVDILEGIVRRGGVSARIAGETLVEYVTAFDEERRHAALEVLAGAGADGALGLAIGLEMAPREKLEAYIVVLGNSGQPRAAGPLARLLRTGAQGAERKRQKAAREAIMKLGVRGVRYLIPELEDSDRAVWVAKLLRDLTGADPKDDKRRTWEKWYRQNRRNLEK